MTEPTSLAYCQIDEVTGIAEVVMNRPRVLNALDVATSEALRDCVIPLRKRRDLRCIHFRANGRAFIAGGDLAAFAEDFSRADVVVEQLLDALEPVIETFQRHPAPAIASVHGAVAGAGMSLVAACDLVVAAESTRFMLAYDKVAAPPDCGASYFLPRLLGERAAASLMLLGDSWTAHDALHHGFINRIAADDDIQEAGQALAARLAKGPSQAYGMYKKLIRQSRECSLREQLDAERRAFCAATKTKDFQRGVSAFLQGRSPEFNND